MSTLLRRDEELLQVLPRVRRYARALTGDQSSGDFLVAESLRDSFGEELGELSASLELYARVTNRFGNMGRMTGEREGLTTRQRQLLLLTALEELRLDDAARVVGLDADEAEVELRLARRHLHEAAATDVLIIEDEPIIAMDIEELVESCGHRVVGVAATETEAVALARREKPGLILADINLGVGGDGTNAVARIMRLHHAPVIFVTAYPERLLTGAALEPAFVIAKPFEATTLAIATYQAVTGGVRLD